MLVLISRFPRVSFSKDRFLLVVVYGRRSEGVICNTFVNKQMEKPWFSLINGQIIVEIVYNLALQNKTNRKRILFTILCWLSSSMFQLLVLINN